jgi:cation diffusion facilitator CzcD-associated flavoprotein CzcO
VTDTHVDVAIIGAGFAGIGLGIQLKRKGGATFRLFERAGDVGGTWRDNRYPGVACDVPSHLYSYSFLPNPDWSRIFAPGDEILDYLRRAVRDERLAPHLSLDTEVRLIRWSEPDAHWRVETTAGTYTAGSVVMAAGRLAEPVVPDVEGLETFAGLAFHSARWPDDLEPADFAGKRVGVVGTGSSAAQLIPRVASAAQEVVVFQRSASWVLPREDREFAAVEKLEFAQHPSTRERLRESLFAAAEEGFDARAMLPVPLASLRDRALAHLEAQVADPRLRALLTPDYEIGCKRVVISDDFYPALTGGNVVLEPSALRSVAGDHVLAESGATFDLDVLIFATGFNSTRPPYARFVFGRGRGSLDEHWQDGMTAFASTVVHGFPNFFILNGPNATLGHNSAIYMMESQFGYVLGALEHLEAGGVPLDVTAQAERDYVRELDERSASTVWKAGGCTSWYVDARSGRLTLIWPGRAGEFRERNGTFDAAPFDAALADGALANTARAGGALAGGALAEPALAGSATPYPAEIAKSPPIPTR